MCGLKPVFFSLLIFLLSYFPCQAQYKLNDHFGAQFGLSLSFGTHINRLGISLKGFYVNGSFQSNFVANGFYNFKTIGSEKSTWESMLSLGLTLGMGKRDASNISNFIRQVGNQTSHNSSITYAYNYYFDQIKTSQAAGTLGFSIGKFSMIFENDLLGFKLQDKYRTGGLGYYYEYDDNLFGIFTSMWTGDPYFRIFEDWVKDTDYPSNAGYMDTSTVPYGSSSVGILAVTFERRMDFEQYIGGSIGIDADIIRHTFQNKFIHDSKILPLNWGKFKNPHIPMIDTEGKPYLFKEDQKIRPSRFFGQVFSNSTPFY